MKLSRSTPTLFRYALAVVPWALLNAGCSGADAPGTAVSNLTADQCNFFDENGKVTVCHATGSARNPITVIRVSTSACVNAHSGHAGDRIAPDGDCGPTACLPATAPYDGTVRCCDGLAIRAAHCVDLCANVACPASDQCHAAGTCDPASGACSNPALANGTACNDRNACTQTDTCQAGACAGANPVACRAADDCHVAGTCNPMNGTCSNPNAANGASCDDHSLCTAGDACANGTCAGAAVDADDHNPCTADACTPGGGVTHSNLPAGTACGAVDLCNGTAACNGAGACVAGTPTATDDHNPCTADSCDPATGAAVHTADDGASCSDGDACTRSDACRAGACVGSDPVTCAAMDQCHAAGTCNPASGACSNPAAANGTACDDGNACTATDTCQAGSCASGSAVSCAASTDACRANVCDPARGCTTVAVDDGTACDDGDACTQTDTCRAGACTGADPRRCGVADQCHAAGTCDPSTGLCSNPAAADGTACSDNNLCTTSDSCRRGTCQGDAVLCPAPDQCHAAGTCQPANGVCSNPEAPEGTTCNDGSACTTGDVCTTGACGGAAVPTDDGNPCTADACSPSGGVSHAPVADGTACGTGRACSAGTCVATCTNPVCPSIPSAYEGFNYTPGAVVTGLNGGSGWSGPWAHTASYAGEMSVVSGGFTYPGLATSGQRMQWLNGGPLAEEQRMVPRQACGSVYIQFISRLDSPSGDGAPNMRLIDSTATNACGAHANGGIGGNDTYDSTHLCILGVTPGTAPYPCNIVPNQPPAPSSCSSAPLSAVNLVVVRIDYGCSAGTRMWVNPNLATFSYASPPAPDAQWLGLAPTFDTLDIFYRATGSIDELRVFQAPSQ
ncbi:MAG: Thiamin-phosphate pyrophosphorylase [Myxococcaceae bacterium]|nr:Thiamin-phosphate pyrophosphorylase [Myxococcaceae bacterium]